MMTDAELSTLWAEIADLLKGGKIKEAIDLLTPRTKGSHDPRLYVRLADLKRRQQALDLALPLYEKAAFLYAEKGALTHALAINKLVRVLSPSTPSLLPAIAQRQINFLAKSGGAYGVIQELITELDGLEFQTLLEESESKTFGAGEVITQGGVEESATFVVVRGQVRISGHGNDGRVREQRVLNPGDVFDEWSLSQGDLPGWAESITEVDLLLFQVDAVASVEKRHPRVAKALRDMRESRALDALIAHQPTLKALDAAARETIPALMEERVVRRNTIVFREGDHSTYVYLVQKGRVEVYTQDGDGKRMELAQLGPGSIFGEAAAFNNTPRTASVRARTDVVLFRLKGEALITLLNDNPKVGEDLKDVFRERVADTLERLDEADGIPMNVHQTPAE